MASRFAAIQEHIDNRVIRERVLILLTALAVVYMLWTFAIQRPVDNERKRVQAELDSIALARKDAESQIASMTLAASSNPAMAKQKEIISLRAQIADTETRLASMTQGLVRAEQLPQALENMLKRLNQLELVAIQTLPSAQMQLSDQELPATKASTGEKAGSGVYKHTVIVKVRGGYFQLIELLQAIEALPWRFYWDALDYRVTQYPNAEIELKVFTLSSEEGLLGV